MRRERHRSPSSLVAADHDQRPLAQEFSQQDCVAACSCLLQVHLSEESPWPSRTPGYGSTSIGRRQSTSPWLWVAATLVSIWHVWTNSEDCPGSKRKAPTRDSACYEFSEIKEARGSVTIRRIPEVKRPARSHRNRLVASNHRLPS